MTYIRESLENNQIFRLYRESLRNRKIAVVLGISRNQKIHYISRHIKLKKISNGGKICNTP